MNPLRPDPQPAYVLLAIILTIFAVMSYRRGFSVASGVLATVAVILIVRFVRGVIVDVQLSKIGIRTEGRVTRVEEVKDKQGRFWRVTFTYADAVGTSHENSIEEYDENAVRRYQKPGAVVNIRFHPDHPDEFRAK